MARLRFLVRVLGAYAVDRDRTCPYCSSADTAVAARKYGLLQLRRCAGCRLLFRWPKDSEGHNLAYYGTHYRQPGLTTDLPPVGRVTRLVETAFRGTDKDFTGKIEVVRSLCPRGRVLDFGCSWGYGVLQLARAGYEAIGFDVSPERAAYGRRWLGVDIIASRDALDRAPAGTFDAIFCNHVLEHLPSPRDAFERFAWLLRPGGMLIAFVPNAGGDSARRLGSTWGPLVCERHPLALDHEFVEPALSAHGFDVHVSADPHCIEEISRRVASGARPGRMAGDELLIIARRRGAGRTVAAPREVAHRP